MRLASAATLAVLISAPMLPSVAQAGGVGLLTTGGVYSERVWYYDASGEQYLTRQAIPMGGAGLDLMLGDRDDRIVGFARFYWNMELPEPDLSLRPLEGTGPHSTPHRSNASQTGVFAVGLQAGVAGDPEKGMFNIIGVVGSGFLTTDHREFVYGELGVGGTVRLSPTLELFGNAAGHLRFRKWARVGATGYGGIRVLFD